MFCSINHPQRAPQKKRSKKPYSASCFSEKRRANCSTLACGVKNVGKHGWHTKGYTLSWNGASTIISLTINHCLIFILPYQIMLLPLQIGRMAEWSNAAVLKTVDLHGSGGSNPSPSAGMQHKVCQTESQVRYAF